MNRRKFLSLTAKAGGALVLGGSAYGAVEAKNLGVTKSTVRIPHLPRAFHGATVAFLADLHHSAEVPLWFLRHAVSMVNALEPDFILLGGDYVTAGPLYNFFGGGARYIAPCFDVLKNLRAKHGVFAATGNHDTRAGFEKIKAAIASAGFQLLSNSGVWLDGGNGRLRLCGVEDMSTQRPDIVPALGDATRRDAVLLVSHNPDFAETITDWRVGLVLSGHTHGGQVKLPIVGAPILPSIYGQKYRYGLVDSPRTQAYVTSGVGTVPLAVRINVPAEIALLSLEP
jgi:hypothetical protein